MGSSHGLIRANVGFSIGHNAWSIGATKQRDKDKWDAGVMVEYRSCAAQYEAPKIRLEDLEKRINALKSELKADQKAETDAENVKRSPLAPVKDLRVLCKCVAKPQTRTGQLSHTDWEKQYWGTVMM